MHMKLVIYVSSQTPAVIFINQQTNKQGGKICTNEETPTLKHDKYVSLMLLFLKF